MGLPWWLSGEESACQCRRRGLVSGPGRSHVPQSDGSYGAQCITTVEPVLQSLGLQLVKPEGPAACALQQEKPTHHN